MVTKEQIINRIISDNGLKSYLEIGYQQGKSFEKIKCERKAAVDPAVNCDFRMTSDEFFERNTEKWDLVFIDGDHTFKQVEKDLINAWQVAKWVVLHDCNPRNYITQAVPRVSREWYGDVWRVVVGFNETYENKITVYNTDCGVGVVKVEGEIKPGIASNITFADFEKRKTQLLNLV